MSIKRSKAHAEFFVMHNATAQDKALSWAARGMLAYLLSKPEGWITSMADLQRQSSGGKTVCQSAFKELETAKYAKREQCHRNGRLVWDTVVYDRPTESQQELDSKMVDCPPAEIQSIENLPAEKAAVYKEQSLENTDIEKTESLLSVRKRTEYPESFEDFWKSWQHYKTPAGNKQQAFDEWKRHTKGVDVNLIIDKALSYSAECRSTDTNTLHACRWIKRRGWDQEYSAQQSNAERVDAALREKWRREAESAVTENLRIVKTQRALT